MGALTARADGEEVAAHPLNVVMCFSHDDVAVIHLKELLASKTLCGKRAFPVGLSRRKITCEVCRVRRPKVLGGS